MQGLFQFFVIFVMLLTFDQGQTTMTKNQTSIVNLVDGESTHRLTRRSVDTSRTAGIAWNDVVDIIFSVAKKDILQQNKDEIPLPDIQRRFKQKYSFITVNGLFSANQGKLRNITSIRRTEDVSVVKVDTIYKMTCVFCLDVLKVRYEHYKVDVYGVGPSGFIEATVGSNSIRMILNFAKEEDGCVSTLEEVKLNEMGDLSVHVSGFGPLDSLGSNIATWFVDQRKGHIVDAVERVLTVEAKKALADFQCDEYASLLML